MTGGDEDGIGGIGSGSRDPLSGVAGVTRAAPGAAAGGAEAVDALPAGAEDQAIARALEAGEIDAAGALERIVDETVAAQLPADAPATVVEALRTELRELLADDPTLLAWLGPGRSADGT